VEWTLVSNEESVSWVANRTWPPDSVRYAALDAITSLQNQGYLFARIDSHHVSLERGTLYATPGARAVIKSVQVSGAVVLNPEGLSSQLETQAGQKFLAAKLETDLQKLVNTYVEAGYHLVRVTVDALDISGEEYPEVGITFLIHEGPRPLLRTVELFGARRTRNGFASRATGLYAGASVRHFDADVIRSRLEETEVFDRVEEPILAISDDSTLIVQVPVTEAPPGTFDMALGYERNTSGRGALVGSGHLAIRNLFGYGRVLALALNRAPGQVSRINVDAQDPFVFGLPMSLRARFEGLQQDSTYGKHAYQMELGYRFEGRLDVFALVTREVTRPGLAGLRIVDGQQYIPVATALFAGLGIRVRDVDSGVNPRKGYLVETSAENGLKDRTLRIVRADTTEEGTRLQQTRLRAKARLFVPTMRRQALVLGGDAMLLHSRELDDSDLFRFGGANSLRGYDEERFRGSFAARILAEYRRLLDEASHALAFFDLGYVDGPNVSGFYPGFGIGIQLDTEAGLISVTAAASTEAPSEVRVHLGISLGL